MGWGGGEGKEERGKEGKQPKCVRDEDTERQVYIWFVQIILSVNRKRSEKFPQSRNITVFLYLNAKRGITGTLQKSEGVLGNGHACVWAVHAVI